MSAETSPAGEADSSNESDANSSTECPTCGDDFSSRTGMKIHHKKAHGESLSGTDVECEYCGTTFRKDVYEAKQYDKHFCPGGECYSNWCSEYRTGEDNPFWQGGNVTVECETCGSELERYPAEIEPGKSYFCNQGTCVAEYESQAYSGEGNPNWRGGGTVYCEWCGNELERDPNQIDRSENFFCGDKSCKGKWQSEYIHGERHPRYDGGTIEYYGPNWPKQRHQARRRDNHTCQRCGAGKVDLGQNPDVHHRVTVREHKQKYDAPEWWEKANQLENLITLCRSCHSQIGAWPVQPRP